MNKLLLIGLAVLLIGAGAFFFLRPRSVSNQQPGNVGQVAVKQPDTTNGSITGKIEDLFAQNKPLSCSFSQSNDNSKSNGTIYVADNKIRGNFTTTIEGQPPIESFIIQDSQYFYSWTLTPPQGTKIKIDKLTEQTDQTETGQPNEASTDFNNLEQQNITYDCQPWTIDQSVFSPPEDINFTDLDQQLDKMEEATEEIDQTACDLCDQIPTAEEQTQCRQSLGCQ